MNNSKSLAGFWLRDSVTKKVVTNAPFKTRKSATKSAETSLTEGLEVVRLDKFGAELN